jgi:catalase
VGGGCSPTPTRTGPRIGVNYQQIPVNAPAAPVHSYSTDGAMRIRNVSDPV